LLYKKTKDLAYVKHPSESFITNKIISELMLTFYNSEGKTAA
jgi:hypothetical protein